MEKELIKSAKHQVNYWWVSLLVGILAVIVGVMSAAHPIITVEILTIFFIANFFVSGIFEIVFAISNRNNLNQWGWTLASGIISLLFACLLIALPIVNMLVFLYYVAFYVLLQSVMGIWGSFTLKTLNVPEWWLYLLVAIFGIFVSLILIAQPAFTIGFVSIIFAISLICYGLFRIFYAFRLKKAKEILD